jgi:hypothetical protein
MADKLITPSDLRKQAQELIKSGKMPTPQEFLKIIKTGRKDTREALKKIRGEE